MNLLMRHLEKYELEAYVDALLRHTAAMKESAPEFTRYKHARLMNTPEDLAVYLDKLPHVSPAVREALPQLYAEMIPELGDHIRRAREALGLEEPSSG